MFADIHTHLLFGTDDGAKTIDDMYNMVDAAYNQGTRFICATPHFHPSFFGDNREAAGKAFALLTEYCAQKYPSLSLALGNELYYKHDCISWLKNGVVKTLGNTRYVLVEFSELDSENFISEALLRLLNTGYVPIIAHAERYKHLRLGTLLALRENGVLIQVNAQSFFERFSFGIKKRLKAMVLENAVDFVSSDTHDLVHRPPYIAKCHKLLVEKYGRAKADALCCENAKNLLFKDGFKDNFEDNPEEI